MLEAGLDSAILDPLDRELRKALLAAEATPRHRPPLSATPARSAPGCWAPCPPRPVVTTGHPHHAPSTRRSNQDVGHQLINAIADMDEEGALALTKELLDGGTPPARDPGRLPGGHGIVGNRFEHGRVLHPRADPGRARCCKADLGRGQAAHDRRAGGAKKGAKVVVGTVKGDIHDIGKDIVVFMLDVNGFEVTDLGIDVPVETFVEPVARGAGRRWWR